MGAPKGFDPTFDFRTDATGPDPDSSSRKLREYHKRLWSKPLPNGDPFELEITFVDKRGYFLHHLSPRGEFHLTSDSAMQTWSQPEKWPEMQAVIAPIPEEEKEHFLRVAHQIGGKVMFPVDSKPTINQARGMNRSIADRFDLTLECIRLHYLGKWNPLDEVLRCYSAFFELFDNFKGYIDFFLLQDLVSDDASRVEFLIEFKDFSESPFARPDEEYQKYRENGIRFVQARNRRMAEYVAGL